MVHREVINYDFALHHVINVHVFFKCFHDNRLYLTTIELLELFFAVTSELTQHLVIAHTTLNIVEFCLPVNEVVSEEKHYNLLLRIRIPIKDGVVDVTVAQKRIHLSSEDG